MVLLVFFVVWVLGFFFIMARICLLGAAKRALGTERRCITSHGSCLVLWLYPLTVCFVAIPLYYSAVVLEVNLLSSDFSLQHYNLNQGLCLLPKVTTEGEGELYLYHASQ